MALNNRFITCRDQYEVQRGMDMFVEDGCSGVNSRLLETLLNDVLYDTVSIWMDDNSHICGGQSSPKGCIELSPCTVASIYGYP